MYSYVPTSGKVPKSARNKSLHVSLRSVQKRRFRGAIDYIVASIRPLSPKAMNVCATLLFDRDGPLGCKTRILKALGGRLPPGNLLLAGHFFLPCCIQ
jgi:hypothetical protein